MAMFNSANPSGLVLSRLHIQAMLSVTPTKPTVPRFTQQLSVPENHESSFYQQCLQVVLLYRMESGDNSGWLMAGWMNESLGMALVEKPILAGRLRRIEEAGNGAGLEIVSNDSGARLVEAQMEMTIDEFLGLKKRKEAKTELVFWEDVDHENPQFSPLFYVQFTNFRNGGYSIGISCSLILADPFAITSFLKRWADIHNSLVSNTDSNMSEVPTFYLPNLRKTGKSSNQTTVSNKSRKPGQTLIYKYSTSESLEFSETIISSLVLSCIEEAEKRIGCKMPRKLVTFFMKEKSQVTKVEVCSKLEMKNCRMIQKPCESFVNGLKSADWDILRADEINFNKENNPAVNVSFWINSASDECLVMFIEENNGKGMPIVVTFPSEEEI